MQCFIYKSSKKDQLYLYVDKKDDFSAIPLALLESFGQLIYVMELQLNSSRKLAREDVNKVMECIRKKGFFVQIPPSVIPLEFVNSGLQLH